MDDSTRFAAQFATLLLAVTESPDDLETQRARALALEQAHRQSVTLVWDNWRLRAGTASLPPTSPPIMALLARLAAHGIREVSFEEGTPRAHLLTTAWILARDPVLGDGGASAVAQLAMSGADGVHFHTVLRQPGAEERHDERVVLADAPSRAAAAAAAAPVAPVA